MLKDNRVILGLSGGVDSTAAALLLKENGYEVIGLYFDIDEKGNEVGIAKAQKVANELGIKLIIKNVYDDFSKCVIRNFIDEYAHGRTPNPCIVCNPLIKFKTLIETADEEGAKYVATGHYARVSFSERQQCHVISVPENERKDQSYMLYRLPKEYIERLILPLSEYDDKEKIREIARGMNLSNSEDKDSQEICFIDDKLGYIEFLINNGVKAKEGNFVDTEGNVLGKHKGIVNYTFGQRKGLGITLGKPAFVTSIDAENNRVVLGDNDDLFAYTVVCNHPIFTATGDENQPKFLKGVEVEAKIRYAAKRAKAFIKQNEDKSIEVIFEEKQRAATPGQSLVLYLDGEVVGGGFIDGTIK